LYWVSVPDLSYAFSDHSVRGLVLRPFIVALCLPNLLCVRNLGVIEDSSQNPMSLSSRISLASLCVTLFISQHVTIPLRPLHCWKLEDISTFNLRNRPFTLFSRFAFLDFYISFFIVLHIEVSIWPLLSRNQICVNAFLCEFEMTLWSWVTTIPTSGIGLVVNV